jgi:hypothetical protein
MAVSTWSGRGRVLHPLVCRRSPTHDGRRRRPSVGPGGDRTLGVRPDHSGGRCISASRSPCSVPSPCSTTRVSRCLVACHRLSRLTSRRFARAFLVGYGGLSSTPQRPFAGRSSLRVWRVFVGARLFLILGGVYADRVIGTARHPTPPGIRVRSLVDRTPPSRPVGREGQTACGLTALRSQRPIAILPDIGCIERA